MAQASPVNRPLLTLDLQKPRAPDIKVKVVIVTGRARPEHAAKDVRAVSQGDDQLPQKARVHTIDAVPTIPVCFEHHTKTTLEAIDGCRVSPKLKAGDVNGVAQTMLAHPMGSPADTATDITTIVANGHRRAAIDLFGHRAHNQLKVL